MCLQHQGSLQPKDLSRASQMLQPTTHSLPLICWKTTLFACHSSARLVLLHTTWVSAYAPSPTNSVCGWFPSKESDSLSRQFKTSPDTTRNVRNIPRYFTLFCCQMLSLTKYVKCARKLLHPRTSSRHCKQACLPSYSTKKLMLALKRILRMHSSLILKKLSLPNRKRCKASSESTTCTPLQASKLISYNGDTDLRTMFPVP